MAKKRKSVSRVSTNSTSKKSHSSEVMHKAFLALLVGVILLTIYGIVQLNIVNEKLDTYSDSFDEMDKFFEKLNAQVKGAAAQQQQAPSQPSAPVRKAVGPDDDPSKGDENAPVTIIEFSDYQCPFCSRFYSQTLPQIQKKYIDTGKVRFVYRDFPLSIHPQAVPAAIAANCAGEQGKYWEYHNKIFDNQRSLSESNYLQWAEDLGLDKNAFATCLKDPKQKAEVQKDFADGSAAGVSGTPAFFINGRLVSGAQPFSVFEQAIEAELSG